MRIVVYIESLKTFTSGMPHRGMLKELIRLRNNDHFIIVYRKNTPEHFNLFLKEIENTSNCSFVVQKQSERASNIFSLFRLKNHCKLTGVSGDVFLNCDAHFLGSNCMPQIITVHDLSSVRSNKYSSLGLLNRWSRKFLIRNGIKNSDHIVSISEFTKFDIKSKYNISEDKISVINNGINDSWFCFNKKRIKESNYWIWYGNFTKRKNLVSLILAYEKIIILKNEQENKSIPKLLLIGKAVGSYFEEVSKLVSSSIHLKENVIFKPQQSQKDLMNFVANSKALLFPSFYEGFGLPVIEAYALGVNVLTSNVTSLPEISGGIAILVDPTDVISIRNGLLELLDESNLKSGSVLSLYSEKFTYRACARTYSELINKIYESSNKY